MYLHISNSPGWLVDESSLPTLEDDEMTDFGHLRQLDPEMQAREPSRGDQLSTIRSIYLPQVSVYMVFRLNCRQKYD